MEDEIDREASRILLARPERVSDFEPRLIARLREAAGGREAAVVEIAGRDSVAAGISAGRSGEFEVLVPTVAYTGTEHGNWDVVLGNARALASGLEEREGIEVLETVVLGSPSWWHAAAGRFSGKLTRTFGFSPACVACHMYLHAARVPLLRGLGAGSIISGERLRHDGRRKLNQLGPALDAYSSVLARHDARLVLPLRDVGEGRAIEEIVGPWAESAHQTRCVMEGNYLDGGGALGVDEGALRAYLDRFLVPFSEAVLGQFEKGAAAPDYLAVSSRVIKGL